MTARTGWVAWRWFAVGAVALAIALSLDATLGRVAGVVEAAPDDDFLSAPLRAEVESLKVEAEQPSTDLEILRRRLEVLWRWSEAFALEGGLMPPASRATRP